MALPWQDRDATQNISPSSQERRLNRYRSVLGALLAHLEEFEATDAPHYEDVLRVARSITQVFDVVPIKTLLESLREQDMESSLRKWLLGCFTKIRRYSEVASILCHRARRISMLRRTRVTIVSGVVNLQGTSVSSEQVVNIENSLARFQYMGETIQMRMLPEWLRGLVQSSSKKYSQSVRNILKEAKVHAEIQLLAYYENKHVKGIRPRILASNKKACALCTTVIAIHGGYQVPKSHGRLYKGWRLPAAHQSGPLQDDLNVELESSISKTLARLMLLSKRPPIEFDNESSIYSFNLSASTFSECPSSIISEDPNAAAAIVDDNLEPEIASYRSDKIHAAESSSDEHTTTDETDKSEDIIAESGRAHVPEHTGEQANTSIPHDSIMVEGSIARLARKPAGVKLEHGQQILFSPDGGGVAWYRSRRIELFIDDTSRGFSLELLRTEEAEVVLRDETRPVADVRTLASEIDVLLSKCANGEVYISHGEEVIRICARSG